MSGDLEITIPNLDEVLAKWKRLEGKEQQKAARTATSKMAQLYRRELKASAPKNTGNLRKHIRMKVRKGRSFTGIWAKVGVLKGKDPKVYPYYAYFLEYGTSGHSLNARGAKHSAFDGSVYGAVEHPGHRAKPFLRPTFSRHKSAAVGVGSSAFIKWVQKVAK